MMYMMGHPPLLLTVVDWVGVLVVGVGELVAIIMQMAVKMWWWGVGMIHHR